MVTRTSDVRGAATDAAVHIELIGDGGSSGGLQPLIASGPQAFERGSTDEFRLLLGQGLGELQQLRVLLDGSGARHPAWHLLQVCSSFAAGWLILHCVAALLCCDLVNVIARWMRGRTPADLDT